MYPKMLSEVIEAIETHFCDEKDVMADCMVWLANRAGDEFEEQVLSNWLLSHGRCDKCGTKLINYQIKQIHSEVEGIRTECLHNYFCPECEVFL